MSPGMQPGNNSSAEEKCPVDHKTRQVYLEQARAARQATEPVAVDSKTAAAPSTIVPAASSSWSSWHIPFFSRPPTDSSASKAPQQSHSLQAAQDNSTLGNSRVVSTIPRSHASSPDSPSTTISSSASSSFTVPTSHGVRPSNSEAETGSDAATGNWIYPSERMFFDAMRRKGHGPTETDMATVVPIHNAVNERAWAEIKAWEAPYANDAVCPGGPKLESFNGLSTTMSPRARMKTLMGYTAPFDRHDWVVDRCGKKVEYLIDFYAGNDRGSPGGKISFYLDVRPKLNGWEGVKMRTLRTLGLV